MFNRRRYNDATAAAAAAAHSIESPSTVDPQWDIWHWGSKWNLHTVCWSAVGCERGTTSVYFGITYVCFIPSKGKVTVLSPHPGSELCSADFDKYLPWSLGLLLSISVWITTSTPWGVYSRSHATWRHGLQICPHRYPGTHFLLGREKQCSVKCLAQGHNEQSHRQGIELGTWPRS